MKRIVLTGCGGPAGVNFCKSVKSQPEKMFLVGTDCNKMHLTLNDFIDLSYVTPRCTEKKYVETLNEIINKEKIEMVHSQPDAEVKVLSDNREKLDAIIFLPHKKTVDICQNKFKSVECWKKYEIPIANTALIKRREDIRKAFDMLGKPVWIRAIHGAGGRGSTPASDFKTAQYWINYWVSRGVKWRFIAQEYLPGRNIAFQSLWKDGELITSQARERIEYIYPYLAPSGITGTPAIAKTIHDDDVNKIATDCVLAIDKNASGVFCVDLKFNKNGVPCPTEINCGRFFTTSYGFTSLGNQLGIMANMPYLYIKLAFGEKIPNISKYNILPKDWYYIRHIDCGERWVKEGEWEGLEIGNMKSF